jgi:SAM-dependent methyltransferase
MNKRVGELIDRSCPEQLDAVEISGLNHAQRNWSSYESLDYPSFDLCRPIEHAQKSRYDFVIAEQVLEHVPEPLLAASNMRQLCRPGGYVLVTTPFLIRIHPVPDDYWRFTPSGLKYLLVKAGLEIEECGSWGNKAAVRGAFYNWPSRRPWQTLRNEEDLPTVVWALARNTAPRAETP